MFRRKVTPIRELLGRTLREEGLETPLLERRLINSWEEVTGKTVARYTQDKSIRNQTLYVKITSPALRSDLSMMRQQLVSRLNAAVGAMIITDVRIY